MKYPFVYSAINYSEGEYYRSSGLGFCESFSDAAEQIEKMCGDELVKIDWLELLEPSETLELPIGMLKQIVHEDFGESVYYSCDEEGEKA